MCRDVDLGYYFKTCDIHDNIIILDPIPNNYMYVALYSCQSLTFYSEDVFSKVNRDTWLWCDVPWGVSSFLGIRGSPQIS